MYKKPYSVIVNGINCERFKFNPQTRAEIRQSLNLGDSLVIGHIGHFNTQKNQERLISIFSNLLEIYPDAKLILCGSGETLEECKRLAEHNDQVIFLPETHSPEKLFAAMDVFVLPSLFEGLPLVGVEAQASGLPCVFSDSITCEVKILDSCKFVSLKETNYIWMTEILNAGTKEMLDNRGNAAREVSIAGFDEKIVKGQVLDLYG